MTVERVKGATGVGGTFESGEDPFDNGPGVAGVAEVFKEDGEFIAPEAGHGVARAEGLAQAAHNGGESVAVWSTVDIDENDGKPGSGAGGAINGGLENRAKGIPGREAGGGIKSGLSRIGAEADGAESTAGKRRHGRGHRSHGAGLQAQGQFEVRAFD
jgi:hypothetical protein